MIKNTIKLIFALVLIVITNTNSLAQSCIHPDRNAWTWPGHNNWFLPTSGDKSYILNQKSGSVSLVQQTDYAIAPWANKIRGYQGVAAASNDKGKLVFFCNGRKAWKADGTLITDKILAGNECGSQEDKTSAVHGTMIVRHPLQPNKYYIITIDDIVNQGSPTVNNQKGSCGNGITFAVIDSSAKLVHASVPIERDITSQKIGAFRTTEDFAATFHANGVDIWITFHPIWQKHLVSYLLTCDGFVSPPVISGQGLIPYTGIAEAIGGVDFSYDGSKIAVGVEINLSGPDVDSYGGQGTVNLYDFNNKTAAVTNRKAIYHNKNGTQNLYNLFFSADAKEIHFGGTGGSGKYNISSNNEATILAAGKLISAPFAGNDGFNGAAMSSSGVIEHRPTTYAKSPLTSGATAVYSSNNMYIPPLEEPDIQEAAARCDTFPNFDIHTYWLCSGKSAEDTLFNRHDYFLLDSNDVKSGKTSPKIDANSATIIGQKTGIFSPKKAGPGTHRIVFVYCGVNDTMDIKITKCSSCEVDLKDTKPQICVGQSVKLDSLIVDNNGVGKWTIDSVPSGAGVSATLSEGSADTLFQALSATTKAGTYKLMYTNTYTGSTCEDSIYIVVNPSPVVTVKDTAICFGQPTATFKATSATASTWVWSEKGTGTNQTTPGSVAGNYTVIAKDAKGCADTATGILTINTLPTVTVKDTAICFGQPAATFKATSATATSWVWSEKGTGTNQTTPGSAAGNYTVIAKDSKGCADTATGKLTINKLPVIKVDTLQMCEGAAALNLTYKSDSSITSQVWSDKGTGSLVTTSATVGGNYIVSVTDLHNCKSSGTGLLTVNTKPVVSLNGATICPGSTQTLDPTITKGTSPFKYSWDSGETVKSITKGAGDFTVTVTDSKNCVASKKATVIESGDLTVLIDGPIILCQGEDSVLLSNYRAIDGYSFKWLKESVATGETTESIVASTSGTYQVDVNKGTCKGSGQVVVTVNALPIVTVANQSMCDGDADKTFTAVSTTATKWEWKDKGTGLLSTTKGKTAGDYTVIVSDVNGCKDTATATLTVNALPTLTLANNVVCEGTGGATFTAVSATAISYLWSGKGSGTASTFLGTTAGSYTVEVKNVNNCLAKATATLVVKKNPVVTLQGAALCEGATATTLTAESDSTIASTIWGGDGSGTGTTYNTSKEGTYTVDITDKNGCKASASAKVLVEALPPTGTETASICAGASAVIAGAAIPGGGNYKYLWSTGETTVSVSSATQKVLTRTATSVPGGCSSVSKYTIAVNENPLLKVLDQEECEKDVLTLSDSETTINCVYLWTPGNLTGSSIKPLTNQTYTVVKTDTSINCSSTATATAKFIPIPNVNITADTISICAGETAYATAVHDARSLLWDTQETSNQASFTSEGSYIVTATNGNCPATDQVYVKVIQYPVSALDKAIQNELVCFESLDTVLILSAGLEREYQYLWNTGETLPTIKPTQEGIYSVVITSQYRDTTSCSITDEVSISEYCPWTLFVPNAFTPDKSGNGLNDVFYAYGTNILEFEMRIFDRWGLMISRTTDMNTGWDGTYKENGTLVQNDVYVWKISFKVENQTGRIVSHDRIGTVTVVR